MSDMYTVSKDRTPTIVWDKAVGSAMASELGLQAGYWPDHLKVTSHVTGKSKVFHRAQTIPCDYEFAGFEYRDSGVIIKVFNS